MQISSLNILRIPTDPNDAHRATQRCNNDDNGETGYIGYAQRTCIGIRVSPKETESEDTSVLCIKLRVNGLPTA